MLKVFVFVIHFRTKFITFVANFENRILQDCKLWIER